MAECKHAHTNGSEQNGVVEPVDEGALVGKKELGLDLLRGDALRFPGHGPVARFCDARIGCAVLAPAAVFYAVPAQSVFLQVKIIVALAAAASCSYH